MPPKFAKGRKVSGGRLEPMLPDSSSLLVGNHGQGERQRGRTVPCATRSHRSLSPVYWGAKVETAIFKGPLGEPIGGVEPGTVVREVSRYEDPFGGWWFSTIASDGSLIWLSFFTPDEYPTDNPEQMQWTRVFDARATPENDATIKADEAKKIVFRPPLRIGNENFQFAAADISSKVRGNGETPSDIELIDFYWKHIDGKDEPLSGPDGSEKMDWNHQYQMCMEKYLFNSIDEVALAENRAALEKCIEDFTLIAEASVVLLIEDLVKASSERVVHPHFVHQGVFYHGRLILKLVEDTPSASYSGKRGAQHYARQHFRSLQLVAMESCKHFLYVPLCSLISFKSHMVWVIAIPPVSVDSCLYAPLASAFVKKKIGERGVTSSENETVVMVELCKMLGASLQLKEHAIEVGFNREKEGSEGKKWSTTMPISTELYMGRDKRVYLSLSTPLFPLLPPIQLPSLANKVVSCSGVVHSGTCTKGGAPHSVVSPAVNQSCAAASSVDFHIPWGAPLRRVRPEILFSAPPLNPDTFIGGCYTDEDAQELMEVSESIRGERISRVADMFGFHRKINRLSQEVVICSLCQRDDIDEEMTFVVCFNAKRCCKICSHCFCQRMAGAFNNANDDAFAGEKAMAMVSFEDGVRCGSAARRGSTALPNPSIADLMHQEGINLTFLPFVYNRLPYSSAFAVEHYFKVEMCARAARDVLQDRLALVTDPFDIHRHVSNFLVAFLASHGPAAESLWAKEIGPAVLRKYPSLGSPFSLAYVSPVLLAERIQELSGILLSESCLLNLRGTPNDPKDFIAEVTRVCPRAKTFLVPQLTLNGASILREKLMLWMERLLLFWIGSSLDDHYDESYQPFYLLGL